MDLVMLDMLQTAIMLWEKLTLVPIHWQNAMWITNLVDLQPLFGCHRPTRPQKDVSKPILEARLWDAQHP